MNTHTEKDLKKWFEAMKKKYYNSVHYDHLCAIETMMFDKFFNEDNLESAAALNK